MKTLFLLFALMSSVICTGQIIVDSDTNPTVASTDTTPFRYPFFGKRVPPFLGMIVGYEGFANPCWETGIIIHYADFTGYHSFGPIIGFAITYKHSLKNSLHTIEGELGAYAPFSIGIGFNRNYYQGTKTFGFRPFIGTSWYHFQFLAGYNFLFEKAE